MPLCPRMDLVLLVVQLCREQEHTHRFSLSDTLSLSRSISDGQFHKNHRADKDLSGHFFLTPRSTEALGREKK